MAASVCVSVNSVKSWEKNGKSDFLKLYRKLLEDNSCLGESTEVCEEKRALYELCCLVVRGTLKADHLLHTIADIIEDNPDTTSLLVDILSVIDVETLALDDAVHRNNFLVLLQSCFTLLPDGLVRERLDLDTLETLGIVQKNVFNPKYVKMKTKLYYKQQKFNLQREEMEGYAKLVTELNQDIGHAVTPKHLLQVIKSLIGCFNLDPNRVLDIILESFECRPEAANFFVPLLREYMVDLDTICQILGFKFHFYQQSCDGDASKSLYKVAALLLYHNLIDLDSFYPHLSPSDSDIKEQYARTVDEAKAYARKLQVVVLSEKKDDDKDKKVDDKMELQAQDNQKLGLLEALLNIGDWAHAKEIMDRMPPFYPSTHLPVARAMCHMIHYCIEPLYILHSELPPRLIKRRPATSPETYVACTQVHTMPELAEQILPMFSYLGPHLCCDPILIGKMTRLGRAVMQMRKQNAEPHSVLSDVTLAFLTAMDEAILPSLALLPANCCMVEEVWAFMKLLPYQWRYRLYGQWKNDSYMRHPRLMCLRPDCVEKAKYIMKRLSKENVKQLGRQIGKLTHSNPGILFEYILASIQRYDNLIGPVVDSLKFITAFSYDVMAYCIIEALSCAKERLKADDTNISPWLQSLASFCGSLCKKYPIDLSGILQYLVNTLKAGKSFDLLVLRDVIHKMAGIEVSEEITQEQLDAVGGGELLRIEGGNFSQVRNTKKSSSRLKDALLEHDLAIPLCLLMSQERNSIVFGSSHEDDRHIKLIGKLYDQCQDTLVQFTSFLSMQLTTDEFSRRLPSVDVLMTTYHILPDAAFALSRVVYSHAISTKFEELRRADRKDKNSKTSQYLTQKYIDAVDHVMKPITEKLMAANASRVWDDLSVEFYATFWSLSMYDLHVPSVAYDRQVQMLKSQISAIEANDSMTQSKRKKKKVPTATLR